MLVLPPVPLLLDPELVPLVPVLVLPVCVWRTVTLQTKLGNILIVNIFILNPLMTNFNTGPK